MSVAPEAKSEALPPAERLLARRDFLLVQSKGRRLHGECFVLLVFDRGDGMPSRIGVTVSRKVGNSVVRHRVKRWVRETFRRNKALFPQSADIVAIAREGKAPASFEAVHAELTTLVTAPNASRASRSSVTAKRKPRHEGSDRGGGTGAPERSDAKHRGR